MNRFYKSGIETDLLCMNQLRFASNIVKMVETKAHVDYLNADRMCKLYVTFVFGGWGYYYLRIFNGIANNIIIQHFGSLLASPYDFHVRISV